MDITHITSLLGGIALFLYGMSIMGAGLEKLAGGKMQGVLQKLTSSTIKGVIFGTLITGVIQSSAGTVVICVGLVNSGIMTLTQSVGVIMGANIGTTVTGQLIRIGHTTVITVDELFHILKRIDPSHKTRPLRAGIIVEHIHFVGTVRPHMLFMQGKHLRIDPVIRQRLVFKRISERFRRPVRRMRNPEMHMQIPVFFGSVPIQPVQRVRKNFFPRFHSRMPFVISFLKTGLEPPGRMALRESAH